MAHISFVGGVGVHGKDAITVRIEPMHSKGHHWLLVSALDEHGDRLASITIHNSDERHITVEDLRGLAQVEAAE